MFELIVNAISSSLGDGWLRPLLGQGWLRLFAASAFKKSPSICKFSILGGPETIVL
jgi:hypothetical protein